MRFILLLLISFSVSANVFDCPGNGITPDFEHESSTIYIPHLFVGDTGISRDVFIKLSQDEGNFSQGRYRILLNNNIHVETKTV